MSLNPYDTPSAKRRDLLESTRRQFLGIMGAFAGVGALVFGGITTLKFMFPNATLEDPPVFKVAQAASEITIGNPLQITAKRVTVVRDDGGFYAVYLVCTHLGCTPNYVSDVVGGAAGVQPDRAKKRGFRKGAEQIPNGWACPCHGSRYFIDSTNFYGPAPRPMDWVEVTFAPDGQLLVDRSKIVVYRQPGVTDPPTWRLDATTKKVNENAIDPSKLTNS